MSFDDRFSGQAERYAQYRPTYPDELFAFLRSVAPSGELAWDCGTGNGQAAGGLVPYFERIVATDASATQIVNARPYEGVEYRVMPAEETDLPNASVDLITAANALHWFDLERFYREADRVLKPGGVLAAWGAGEVLVSPEIDEVVRRFSREVVGEYWSAGNRRCWKGYGVLDFPFEEITAPAFAIEEAWTMGRYLGYVTTWSAFQGYVEARGENPIGRLAPELREAWGDPSISRITRWPLTQRFGRKA